MDGGREAESHSIQRTLLTINLHNHLHDLARIRILSLFVFLGLNSNCKNYSLPQKYFIRPLNSKIYVKKYSAQSKFYENLLPPPRGYDNFD